MSVTTRLRSLLNYVTPGADPHKVPLDWIKGGNFAIDDTVVLNYDLPYIVINNSDAINHLFSFVVRTPGGAPSITALIQLNAGVTNCYPVLPYQEVSIDSMTASVIWHYSDLPVTGPGPPSVVAGSGNFETSISGIALANDGPAQNYWFVSLATSNPATFSYPVYAYFTLAAGTPQAAAVGFSSVSYADAKTNALNAAGAGAYIYFLASNAGLGYFMVFIPANTYMDLFVAPAGGLTSVGFQP